jgi:putative ABC transport system permease protein
LPQGALTLCEGYSQTIVSITSNNIDTNYEKALYIIEANNGNSHLDLDFGDDTVALPEKYARELNVKVGDEVSISYEGNLIKSKVGQVYEAFVYNYVMIHASHPGLSEFNITYSYVFVNIDKSIISVDEAVNNIKSVSYVSSTQTQEGWMKNIKDVVGGILVMTNAVKIFAILLALVVLYNLALMNYRQRNRDIATLKVLGFYKKEIALSLLIESLTLTLLGSLIGLLVGYPFMLAVMQTNIVNLVEYLYRIEPLTYVISFALTFLVSVVINVYFSLMTRKIKMVESLKSVE